MGTRISADVRPYLLPEADRHVVSRFAYGVDESLIGDCRAAGSGLAWFDRQLQHQSIADTAADQALSWYPLLREDPATRYRRSRTGGPDFRQYGAVHQTWWMAHAALSRRHVHTQLVSFWSNLLYIPIDEERSFPWRVQFDQTIRSQALGTFRELLRACVVHPAMSSWLNNNDNTARGINENLGRELLELYTVGREAKYTEAHVKDAARLLTGFRTRRNDAVEAWYDPSKHWTGPVTVMDFRHPNSSGDGRAALNALLDYLALHPATAQRIAYRLCQRFVTDVPPAQIVKAVAAAYTASRSDIRRTLQALVRHPQFAGTRRGRLSTPIEDVVSTARVLGLAPTRPTDQTRTLAQRLVAMASDSGQSPFRWPRPDGYPERASVFNNASRILYSWQQHMSMATDAGATSYTQPAPANLLPTAWPRRLDELVEHQSRILLGRPTDPAALTMISSYLRIPTSYTYGSAATVPAAHLSLIRGSILALPEGLKR